MVCYDDAPRRMCDPAHFSFSTSRIANPAGRKRKPPTIQCLRLLALAAGCVFSASNEAGVSYVGQRLRPLNPLTGGQPVALDTLTGPLAAINVGLESFADSLKDQGAEVVWVDWRPPAGGNERLPALLARMRG